MAPTITAGSVVDADYAAFKNEAPKRDDIVVFLPPRSAASQQCGVPSEPTDGRPCERAAGAPDPAVRFIKRVVGLPGDWIKVVNNHVYLAKSAAGPFVEQHEPFIAKGTPCDELCNLRKPIQVSPDHLFMMGDNRGESDDSRDWGPVPTSALLAKVLVGAK